MIMESPGQIIGCIKSKPSMVREWKPMKVKTHSKITSSVDFVLSDDGTISQKVCPWSTDDILRAKKC